MSSFFTEEIHRIAHELPNLVVEITTPQTIQVLLRKKLFGVRIVLHACDGYPQTLLAVELRSKQLDDELLRKIEKLAEKEGTKHIGRHHAVPILQFVQKVVNANKLLLSWQEIVEIKKLLTTRDTLQVSETTGVLKLVVHEGNYYVNAEIVVPTEYPMEKVEPKIIDSNFPPDLVTLLANIVQSIPHKKHGRDSSSEEMTSSPLIEVHKMKHDVQFLKQLSDLKDASANDKAIRRQKKTLVRNEIETEMGKKEKEAREVVTESSTHLLQVGRCIIETWTRYLPHQKCQVCKEYLLSSEPSSKNLPLERLTCGHFYHRECLFQYLATPPIARQKCHLCKSMIFHPIWNEAYIKKMQKQEALKQAKEREIADVTDFLNI